jgi:hypothetical protein
VLQVGWDPRETGVFLPERFETWTAPAGEPLTRSDRERVFDALWRVVVKDAGVTAIIDESR